MGQGCVLPRRSPIPYFRSWGPALTLSVTFYYSFPLHVGRLLLPSQGQLRTSAWQPDAGTGEHHKGQTWPPPFNVSTEDDKLWMPHNPRSVLSMDCLPLRNTGLPQTQRDLTVCVCVNFMCHSKHNTPFFRQRFSLRLGAHFIGLSLVWLVSYSPAPVCFHFPRAGITDTLAC